MNIIKIERAIKDILEAIGENPDREGLKDTPKRVAAMYAEMFEGLTADPLKEMTVFHDENHQEMIIVKDIPFYSFCEHHLLPFFGTADVAYIPNKNIIGLSKIGRLVDIVAKRPQVQERMTTDIANLLMKGTEAQGVMVVVRAEHLCMSMRGIKKPGSKVITSAVRGVFEEDAKTRNEALSLLG